MSVRVGVAGMTHLGLVSAAAISAKGFETVCFDPDAEHIRRLNVGELSVSEPGLTELLVSNGTRQKFSSAIADLAACDIVYIASDVPTDDRGTSDLRGIIALIDAILPHLAPHALLVILCQVPPGFTRKIPLAQDRLYYQVETLIFGRAVERALNPERFIVGCADPARPAPESFACLLKVFDCPVLPMRYESAELAKISINMCLVASIGVANTMAELCENIGATWDEIAPALKLDRRIGAFSYLSPGLGIAGGNLERDLATVIQLADHHHTDAGIVRAWIANSCHRRDWAAQILRARLVAGQDKLAVWGLAYKENTNAIKNSPSLATLAQLRDILVCVHDPLVPVEKAGHPRAKSVDQPLDALEGAQALAILTPWPVYRDIAPIDIARRLRGHLVLDPYRVLAPDLAQAAGLEYHTLGMPPLIPGTDHAHP